MYIFSMTGVEVETLAGYVRYYKTIIMFIYGICLITILHFNNNYKNEIKFKNVFLKTILIIFIFIPVLQYKGLVKELYKKPNNDSSVRKIVIDLKSNNQIEEGKSYIIYGGNKKKDEDDYIYNICKYDFRSADIKVIKDFSDLQSVDEIFNYDYFIILDKTDEIKEFLNTIGGDENLNVIRFK